jgi:hypothetical protein
MKLNLTCSFCGRTDEQVQRLIAGPQVFICDRCVATCNTILAEHPPGDAPKMSATVQVQGPRRWWQSFVEWWSARASQGQGVSIAGITVKLGGVVSVSGALTAGSTTANYHQGP